MSIDELNAIRNQVDRMNRDAAMYKDVGLIAVIVIVALTAIWLLNL